jgi:hypothetical protein
MTYLVRRVALPSEQIGSTDIESCMASGNWGSVANCMQVGIRACLTDLIVY